MRHFTFVHKAADILSMLWPRRCLATSAAPKRIGVLLQWGIGDAVLTVPLLRTLRAVFEDAAVELIGKPFLKDLFADEGLADQYHRLVPPWTKYSLKYRFWEADWRIYLTEIRNIRRHSFDILIAPRWDVREILQLRLLNANATAGFAAAGGRKWITNDFRITSEQYAKLHRAEAAAVAAQRLTGQQIDPRPRLNVSTERSVAVFNHLKSAGYVGGRLMVVHGGAGSPIRRWGGEKFSAVLARMPLDDSFIVIIDDEGSEDIKLPPNTLGIRWRSSLADLKALLHHASLFIGCDSGVMHLAAACGCKVVAVFGPGSIKWFRPYGNEHRIVAIHPMPCRPCFDKCIYQMPICMNISADGLIMHINDY